MHDRDFLVNRLHDVLTNRDACLKNVTRLPFAQILDSGEHVSFGPLKHRKKRKRAWREREKSESVF